MILVGKDSKLIFKPSKVWCVDHVTKTWFACHASFKDNRPLHSALVISTRFPSMFNYILSARRKILIELPNMHPFTMTTHTGTRHLLSTWLCRFTDAFLQSRSCLTRFQQTGRFNFDNYDGKIITGELQIFKHLWSQTRVVCTYQCNCLCYHPWSGRMKLLSALLSPGTDEKLLLDQKWRITVEGPVTPLESYGTLLAAYH